MELLTLYDAKTLYTHSPLTGGSYDRVEGERTWSQTGLGHLRKACVIWGKRLNFFESLLPPSAIREYFTILSGMPPLYPIPTVGLARVRHLIMLALII